MSNKQGKLSISFIVFLALLIAIIPFFSVITLVPKALAAIGIPKGIIKGLQRENSL